MKFRIAAAATVGVVLIGILAWPLTQPSDIVSLTAISAGGAITLVALAFLAGFIGYFFSWPYGLQIGILAVPAGLTIWAVRSPSIADFIRLNPASLEYRQALFGSLKWEPIFWLLVVVAGFIGVLLGHLIAHKKAQKATPAPGAEKPGSKPESWLFLVAPVATLLGISLALASDKILHKAKSGESKEKANSKLSI